MSWYSVEPLLSLSARFTFSDIVMILERSYLRRVDSYVTISAEYILDHLYVPMELFSTYQDRPDTSDVILGHISLIQLLRQLFSHRSVTVFHHLAERYCICFAGHYSRVFLSRWVFNGAWHSDYSLETLSDYSFQMTMDSDSMVFWVRGVWLIMTFRQASWSSWMGYETMFAVDLIILTC